MVEATGRGDLSETTSAAVSRLTGPVRAALREARVRGEPVVASATLELPRAIDPTATILASARGGEPVFCLEQPERGGWALAGCGCVVELTGAGEGRLTTVGERWRAVAGQACTAEVPGPPGTGLVALGGLAFSAQGCTSELWRPFAPASLVVPEITLLRHQGTTWLTAAVLVAPDDTAEELVAGMAGRLQAVVEQPLPLLDPAPEATSEIRSVMPPSHYEEAVARAVQRVRAGELAKVVLAREVEVRNAAAPDPAAVVGILREGFPACFTFAVRRGESTFLGASPELLVRREGGRASSVALAGSIRRSADPAVDDHLGEQLLRSEKDRVENDIVARRIERALEPHSVWVAAAPDPELVKVANIQHLARPIRAQLARPLDVLALAGLLHPTPAVGGEPWAVAAPLIPALEGFDRGWYAGAIGWVDRAGDGEFCVALRCALVRGRGARLFAGAGIVADSDPAAELAETEVKLGALLPVLAV